MPHFDAKNEADLSSPRPGSRRPSCRPPFTGTASRPTSAQARRGRQPRARAGHGRRQLAGIASEDIGRTAYGIFKRGKALVGQTVSIAGEHLTGAEYAEEFAEALGEPVHYYPVPFEGLRAAGFPGAGSSATCSSTTPS